MTKTSKKDLNEHLDIGRDLFMGSSLMASADDPIGLFAAGVMISVVVLSDGSQDKARSMVIDKDPNRQACVLAGASTVMKMFDTFMERDAKTEAEAKAFLENRKSLLEAVASLSEKRKDAPLAN